MSPHSISPLPHGPAVTHLTVVRHNLLEHLLAHPQQIVLLGSSPDYHDPAFIQKLAAATTQLSGQHLLTVCCTAQAYLSADLPHSLSHLIQHRLQLPEDIRQAIMIPLAEGLINAFEHGCLHLSQLKEQLLEREHDYAAYTELVKARTRDGLYSNNFLSCTLWLDDAQNLLFQIEDSGPGHNHTPRQVYDTPTKRGLLMVEHSSMWYKINNGGRCLTACIQLTAEPA